MHMADALISPTVGGALWIASAGLTAYSARRLKADADERRAPLMGVLGAFVFAAQMVNFSIPGTGSSGHLAGGMLLAALLGPHAAFLTMASILTVQALFFADGGLLALGCNIFNLGFFACFIAYPLIYRKIAAGRTDRRRLFAGAVLSSVVALQLGAFGVVLETAFSGISELPLRTFALMMQPIHLAVGLVEGFVTAAVIAFVGKARPEILEVAAAPGRTRHFPVRNVLAAMLVAAALTGGILSWFASSSPDGLEWSMLRTAGRESLETPADGLHAMAAAVQEKLALMPDYDFRKSEAPSPAGAVEQEKGEGWPAPNPGTSAAGLIGGTLTLALAGLIGLGMRKLAAK